MTTKFAISAINRRQFLSTTAAAALMAGVSMPKIAFGADKVVKIGFLAPLTGAVAAWGKPGLDGLHIWADRVNGAGGIPTTFCSSRIRPSRASTAPRKTLRASPPGTATARLTRPRRFDATSWR